MLNTANSGHWDRALAIAPYNGNLPTTAQERRNTMIKLTKTMLDKSIIDCNAACREVALSVGVDFEKMAPGDRAEIPAGFISGPWTASVIRFYRTNNARGDRRISIKGLKQKAVPGDVVRLRATKGGQIHIIIDGAL